MFLGFQLSADRIRPDPNKLMEIENFPNPKDRKQLQAFLGVCGYYRRFSVCGKALEQRELKKNTSRRNNVPYIKFNKE